MAPEMMKNKAYDNGVDWFSFGILLFEMLSGKNPMKDENQQVAQPEDVSKRIEEILAAENDIMSKYGANFSPDAYDLLESLLKYDP